MKSLSDTVTSLAEVWIEIDKRKHLYHPILVTSLAEVWIEIQSPLRPPERHPVTSLAEVWIEIVGMQNT